MSQPVGLDFTSGSGFCQWVWIASGSGYENPMGQTPCCIMWSTHNHGINWLTHWPTGWLNDWLTDSLTPSLSFKSGNASTLNLYNNFIVCCRYCLAHWMAHCIIDSLIDSLTACIIDSLAGLLTDSLAHWLALRENRMVSGDMAGVTTRGVPPHTPMADHTGHNIEESSYYTENQSLWIRCISMWVNHVSTGKLPIWNPLLNLLIEVIVCLAMLRGTNRGSGA